MIKKVLLFAAILCVLATSFLSATAYAETKDKVNAVKEGAVCILQFVSTRTLVGNSDGSLENECGNVIAVNDINSGTVSDINWVMSIEGIKKVLSNNRPYNQIAQPKAISVGNTSSPAPAGYSAPPDNVEVVLEISGAAVILVVIIVLIAAKSGGSVNKKKRGNKPNPPTSSVKW